MASRHGTSSWARTAFALGLVASLAGAVAAQPAPSCEDQLRAARVLGDRYHRSRGQGELEAAAVIADLLKEIERQRAALEAAHRPAKPEAPKP